MFNAKHLALSLMFYKANGNVNIHSGYFRCTYRNCLSVEFMHLLDDLKFPRWVSITGPGTMCIANSYCDIKVSFHGKR